MFKANYKNVFIVNFEHISHLFLMFITSIVSWIISGICVFFVIVLYSSFVSVIATVIVIIIDRTVISLIHITSQYFSVLGCPIATIIIFFVIIMIIIILIIVAIIEPLLLLLLLHIVSQWFSLFAYPFDFRHPFSKNRPIESWLGYHDIRKCKLW